MKTWEDFRKFQSYRIGANPDDFYGCVNAEGEWFDSGVAFGTAVHWCCCSAGQHHLDSEAAELEWLNTEGRKRGYSIIHGTLLKQMYEKGLIK